MADALSSKQQKIMQHVQAHGSITLTEAVGLVGGNLYANDSKHVGAVLSRLVHRGLLVRIKPGLFQVGEKPALTPDSIAHNLKPGDRWGAYWLHDDGQMRLYAPENT